MHLIGYMCSPVGDYTSCKLALICPSIAELCSYAFNKVYQMHVCIWLGWALLILVFIKSVLVFRDMQISNLHALWRLSTIGTDDEERERYSKYAGTIRDRVRQG